MKKTRKTRVIWVINGHINFDQDTWFSKKKIAKNYGVPVKFVEVLGKTKKKGQK